ncbi:MAG: hypothetical protein H6502_03055 [Candidatus Woesearchaeota archaeon]|nr:MAG: hypothetical protein H6502_03055 [Candidatus Woesearchaeota archaeon]
MKSFLLGFKKGFKLFSENIALIVNVVLLTFVYVIGIGITSLVAKLFGKHFMAMRLDKKKKTYWEKLELKKESMDSYYRQF